MDYKYYLFRDENYGDIYTNYGSFYNKKLRKENDEVMGKKVNEGQNIDDTPIGRAANGQPQKSPEEIEADRKEAEKRRKEVQRQEAQVKRQASKKKVFTNNSPGQISFLKQPQENKDN